MARYHINGNGEPGICKATQGGCPFGSADEHFDTPEAAREAFEASNDSFAVVLTKAGNTSREVNSFDANLSMRMARAVQEFEDAGDKNKWIEDKVMALDEAQANLDRTLPGTAERSEALVSRIEAREELLAADLVVWRDSPFYNEAVEQRMKDTTINVSDADSSIEQALADQDGLRSVAAAHGISQRDAENILDVAHRDYLRPRSPMSTSIRDLSANDAYASTTAYVFRVDPAAVQGVLNYASNYSRVTKPAEPKDLAALLD